MITDPQAIELLQLVYGYVDDETFPTPKGITLEDVVEDLVCSMDDDASYDEAKKLQHQIQEKIK